MARLDFSQLTHINRSFIPDNLREQESDIVYSVPFRSESKTEELLIYILIEQLEIVFNFGDPKPEMPDSITQNLNPAFELRP